MHAIRCPFSQEVSLLLAPTQAASSIIDWRQLTDRLATAERNGAQQRDQVTRITARVSRLLNLLDTVVCFSRLLALQYTCNTLPLVKFNSEVGCADREFLYRCFRFIHIGHIFPFKNGENCCKNVRFIYKSL